MEFSKSSPCLSTLTPRCLDPLHFTPPEPQYGSTHTRNSDSIWNYPSLLSSVFLLHRHSGTDSQGTLFLIRQMAWGETLIWTSSASKRTALPGWAKRPETANYTALMLLPRWLIHSISAWVCVFKPERHCEDFVYFNWASQLSLYFNLFNNECL